MSNGEQDFFDFLDSPNLETNGGVEKLGENIPLVVLHCVLSSAPNFTVPELNFVVPACEVDGVNVFHTLPFRLASVTRMAPRLLLYSEMGSVGMVLVAVLVPSVG